jgi:hypothetical protein
MGRDRLSKGLDFFADFSSRKSRDFALKQRSNIGHWCSREGIQTTVYPAKRLGSFIRGRKELFLEFDIALFKVSLEKNADKEWLKDRTVSVLDPIDA